MEVAPNLLIAFITGLLGSVHCVGMCGGILTAIGLRHADSTPLAMVPRVLAYNLGRISSYMVAGAIVGTLGAGIGSISDSQNWVLLGRIAASLVTIGLGIYVWGWTPALAFLERIGGWIWKWIRPAGTWFKPSESWLAALGAGVVWGWLPCGMVYAVLSWALTASSAMQGALTMGVFGLGTLPTMIVLGSSTLALQKYLSGVFRRISGILIVLYGVYLLLSIFYLTGSEIHHHHH